MRIVGLDNYVNGVDYHKFNYNHDKECYDFLIGKIVRGDNLLPLGRISYIDHYTDAYGHEYAVAVLDSGRRINCRNFVNFRKGKK